MSAYTQPGYHKRIRGRRLYLSCLVIIAAAVICINVQAQENQKPTNLQVLDSTMTHDQVIAVMRNFSDGLGVGCGYCHAEPKKGQRERDFASDENKLKLTARTMLRMTGNINNTQLAHLPATTDTSRITVQCVTCHHGQPRPLLLQDVLMKARKAGGMAALDSTYRALRNEYYGGFTYDFTDRVLAQLALNIADESETDAMAVLSLNQEFNPDSYVNEWATGQLFLAKADTTSAVIAFKHALELNPEFRPARRELKMLGIQ